NLIHEGADMEDVISQMQGNTNEGLSIPWLEVEDLYDGSQHSRGQEKVIEIEVEKMVKDYDGEKDNSEGSFEKTDMEKVMDIRQKDIRKLEMLGDDRMRLLQSQVGRHTLELHKDLNANVRPQLYPFQIDLPSYQTLSSS
ncbi:MAG: hypothetical protein EZS28_012366, partial [Streblomastix strix]